MISISRMKELVEETSITAKEFIKKNKKEDLCFLICDGKLSDKFEDYFEENKECVTDYQSLQDILENAKHIEVYKKYRCRISGTWIAEYIEGYLEDNFGYDPFENGSLTEMLGVELFDKFANKVNKKLCWYTSGRWVYALDLSKEFEEYLKDDMGEDYPKEQIAYDR